MKNLIKNASLIGLLLLGVACKGPNGVKGMEMTSCDVDKEAVKKILTGNSKSCSGFTKSAITTGEAEEILQDTFLTSDGAVVTIEDNSFWSIFDLGGKVIALKGQVRLEEDSVEGDERLTITTLLDGETMAEGTIEFAEEITMTVKGQLTTMSAYTTKNIDLLDEDIIIITSSDDLLKL